VLLLPLTLGGCAQSFVKGTSRQIPADCEQLAEPVNLPNPHNGRDLGLIAADNRAAAVTANQRLGATRDCQKQQRQGFAK
jgi:hypothetical protein